MPTVLELVGLKPPDGLEGRSLVPLLKGGRLEQMPARVTKLAQPHAKPGSGVPENSTGTIARVDAEWKLISVRRPPARGGKKWSSTTGARIARTGTTLLRGIRKSRPV
jgi:arylsulfatase A-like enzyme